MANLGDMTTAIATPATRRETRAQGWVLPLSVLIVGSFMSVLDSSIVNVAVPRIQVDLSADPKNVEWIVTGYTLALGIVVPLTGWLGIAHRPDQALHPVDDRLLGRLGTVRHRRQSRRDDFLPSRAGGPGGILPVVTMTML